MKNKLKANKKKSQGMKSIQVALAVIVRNRQILICKRPTKAHLGGYWEFPGGKKKANETWLKCVRREVKEELGMTLQQIKRITLFSFNYPDRAIDFQVFQCRIAPGTVQPNESHRVKWVSPTALKRYRFPPANKNLIRKIGDALFQS